MTLDPRTIEACAKAMKAERERLIAQPLASVWRQLAEAAIRALASRAQSSDSRNIAEAIIRDCIPGGQICDPQEIADNIRTWFKSSDGGVEGHAAGTIRTTVRQLVDDPNSASGKSLRDVEVAAPAGNLPCVITIPADDFARFIEACEHQPPTPALRRLMAGSSPAEVSEDELADFIDQLDILIVTAISPDDEAADVARALLAKFIIRRRV